LRAPHNILVITYWGYHDALVQSYTLPYVKIIHKYLPEASSIFVATLDPSPPLVDPALSDLKIKNISLPYKGFGIRAGIGWAVNIFNLYRLIRREKVDTIHVWCTTAGMIGYILSVLTGKRFIIDSYEPHAESMVENGTWKKNSLQFRILWFLEKRESRRASVVIATTKGMREYAKIKYGVEFQNYFTKPACVDLNLFSLDKKKNKKLLSELGLESKIVCVYAGKFGGIYLREELFEFFKAAYAYWKDRFRIVLLTSHSKVEIMELAKRFGIPEHLFLVAFVKHNLIAEYIGLGDFALTPVKSLPTKKYCTPVKDGEYWAMGVPVIITANISDDSELIRNNGIGYVWEKPCLSEYQKSIQYIDQLLAEGDLGLTEKIRNIAVQHRNFRIAENIYKTIYYSD
jgi:glycosyltransferase involved in cell wall biosynthesis